MTEPTPSPTPGTQDVAAYLRPLWRWKWIVLLTAIIAVAGTYAVSSRRTKQYASSTRVYIQATDPAAAVTALTDGQVLGDPSPQDMQDLATLFTAQSLITTVYQKLGLPFGSAGTISVSPLVGPDSTNTSFLVVSTTSHSPALAASLANTSVSVFLASRRAAQLQQATTDADAVESELRLTPHTLAYADQRQSLQTEDDQLRTVALNPSPEAQQINTAQVPSTPTSPKPLRDAAIGGALGLLLGIAAAFGLELIDKRLTRVASVESTYSAPVLAVLPHVRHPAPRLDGRTATPPAFLEPIRSLRFTLGSGNGTGRPRSVLVTSGMPGEGKSDADARPRSGPRRSGGERPDHRR